MKGPKHLSEQDRQKLYQQIPRFPLTVSEKDLAFYTQQARLDARLAEVITEHIRDFWWKHDARALNKRLRSQPWPSAIKPMLYQIMEYCKARVETKKQFSLWMRDVLSGVANSPPQLYFISSLKPRARSLDREVDESLATYSKAGYYAMDVLFNKGFGGELRSFQDEMEKPGNAERVIKLQILASLRTFFRENKASEIEERLGIDRTTLSQIKAGKVEGMSIDRLARFLDRIELI